METSKENLEDIFNIEIEEIIFDETGIYIKQKNKDYYKKLKLSKKKYKENEFEIMKKIDQDN